MQARLTTYSMVSGALLTDYLTPVNAKLQTNPTVRMDGMYTALALWGDAADVPTVVLLQAGSSVPLFTYTTPGSMFAVDIVLDGTTLYFSAAGKAVPANEMGEWTPSTPDSPELLSSPSHTPMYHVPPFLR